jgi:hypothetical protein
MGSPFPSLPPPPPAPPLRPWRQRLSRPGGTRRAKHDGDELRARYEVDYLRRRVHGPRQADHHEAVPAPDAL